MVFSTITFGVSAPNIAPNPINPQWILEGNPQARIEQLSVSADGTAATYIWDCTAGRFNWFYSFDETFHILEGTVTLKEGNGTRVVSAGDTVFFPIGSSAEWTVEKYVRKLAFCRVPYPEYLNTARRVARRVKRLLRGQSNSQNGSGLL
jgi:uncharacterized cupin superfamily protein